MVVYANDGVTKNMRICHSRINRHKCVSPHTDWRIIDCTEV